MIQNPVFTVHREGRLRLRLRLRLTILKDQERLGDWPGQADYLIHM